MKNILSLLSFIMPFHVTFSQSYTESSTGLNTISWDGGNTEIEFGDMDGDGNLDAVSIGDHNAAISSQTGILVWFGDGAGNWSLTNTGNFGYGGCAVGDADNDGFMDVGYGQHHDYSSTDFGDQLLEVALGNGTGLGWVPWDDSLGMNGETYGMGATDFGDYNNDGRLDLGSLSFGCCAGVHAYRNNGNGTWTQTFGFTSGNASNEFVFGDINNDGNLDFATAHQAGTVYLGNGSGNFQTANVGLPPAGIIGYLSLDLGDLDNDGTDELVIVQYVSSSAYDVKVFKFDTTTVSWNPLSTLPGKYWVVKLGDMNRDAYLDLVTFENQLVTVWAGNGGSSWTVLDTIRTSGVSGTDIALGDEDHNGYTDIMLLAEDQITIFTTRHVLRFFKYNSTPGILDVTPLQPQGRECFHREMMTFIKWNSIVPAGQTAEVDLYFSASGRSGPWTPIAANVPNSGIYQWQVPSLVSNNCFIRYTIHTPTGSYTAFTPAPFLVGCGDTVLCHLPASNFIPEDTGLSAVFRNTSSLAVNSFWDFGDGDTSSAVNASHVYSAYGKYDVCLITTNACGSDTLCREIELTCGTVEAGFTVSISSPLTGSFANTSKNAISWVWDFGDGDTSHAKNPVHIYSSLGTYTVCLVAFNICFSDTFCAEFRCVAPVADFTFTNAGAVYSFSDASTDATGWLWDFGDGDTSTGENPVHTYTADGSYKVCLTVSGCSTDSSCKNVQVEGTGLAGAGADGKITVRPNPSEGIFNITFGDEGKADIRVGDVLGQEVFGREINADAGEKFSVDLRGIAGGIYHLSILQGDRRYSGLLVLIK